MINICFCYKRGDKHFSLQVIYHNLLSLQKSNINVKEDI